MASKSPTPDLSAVDALTRVTGALGATEARPGQVAMVQAVERVIRNGGRLTVAAPTGSGKSFGLLVPAIVAGVADGRRVVVVTATKALQDQYVADLAHLERTIGDTVPFAWAVQKGRGNYLCAAALDRVRDALNPAQGQLDVQPAGDDDELEGVDRDELDQVLGWAEITVTGDLAELPAPPSARTAAAVTCSPGGCPGSKCEKSLGCPAMAAADKANEADVVIVNAALFAQSLRDRGYDIGDAPMRADILLVDECHEFPDAVVTALGVSVTRWDVDKAIRAARKLDGTEPIVERLTRLRDTFDRTRDIKSDAPVPEWVVDAVSEFGDVAVALATKLTRASQSSTVPKAVTQLRILAAVATKWASAAREIVVSAGPGVARWCERSGVHAADVRVADRLRAKLWEAHPGMVFVAASATLPRKFDDRIGCETERLEVESPFDHKRQAILYVPTDIPAPKARDAWADAAIRRTIDLAECAGWRMMSLHTSIGQMNATAEALRAAAPAGVQVLTQRDASRDQLVRLLRSGKPVVVCASRGWMQGVDVGGLSMVVIDKLPFPMLTDPVMKASRDLAGDAAFRKVDLPRAAEVLAQAFGRLIRSGSDWGVVAVLDSRLATAGYRSVVLDELPSVRRSVRLADVAAHLAAAPAVTESAA